VRTKASFFGLPARALRLFTAHYPRVFLKSGAAEAVFSAKTIVCRNAHLADTDLRQAQSPLEPALCAIATPALSFKNFRSATGPKRTGLPASSPARLGDDVRPSSVDPQRTFFERPNAASFRFLPRRILRRRGV
jgi:hypothetical protein